MTNISDNRSLDRNGLKVSSDPFRWVCERHKTLIFGPFLCFGSFRLSDLFLFLSTGLISTTSVPKYGVNLWIF